MENRLKVLVVVLVCLLATGAKGVATNLGNGLSVDEIAIGVYVVIDRIPVPCNSLIVKVSDKEVVWCDTPYETAATEAAYKWICERLGDVNMVEINTGFHADNLGGNEFLLAKGIPVYGADLTARLISERGPQEKENMLKYFSQRHDERRYEICRQMNFKGPDHTFEIGKGLVLKMGEETVEVYYPGPSHTEDNTVVYFRKRDLLFGGCMVKSLDARDAGYTADADMKQWPRSVEKVRARYPDAKIVVPGHGTWGDAELLRHTVDLLDGMKGKEVE